MGNQCYQLEFDEKKLEIVDIEKHYSCMKINSLNPTIPDLNKSDSLKHATLTSLESTKCQVEQIKKVSFNPQLHRKQTLHFDSLSGSQSPSPTFQGIDFYQFPNGVYKGKLIKGKREGVGEFYYHDGSYFKGEWINDLANGNGKLIFSEGEIYKGEFQDDQQHGWGSYSSKLFKYQGEWRFNQPFGKGVEEYHKLYKYEGQFLEGLKHGKGHIIWLEDNARYEGEFIENKMEGYGTYFYPNGEIYQGYFKSDKFHGKGTFKWNDGKQYSGEYVMGKKEGYGIITDNKGKQLYAGYWQNGLQQGQGTAYTSQGVIEGTWENGILK